MRGATVLVLGTQYVHVVPGVDAERQVRDYPLTEVVRMQGYAVRQEQSGRFHLFCQAESKDTFTRFLDDKAERQYQVENWWVRKVRLQCTRLISIFSL